MSKEVVNKDELHESLSLEKQQELLEKFDLESNQRNPQNFMKHAIYVGLLAFTLYQLYTAVFGQFPAQIQRTVHLSMSIASIPDHCSNPTGVRYHETKRLQFGYRRRAKGCRSQVVD